ncbi:MAG: glutathione peroxidase [Gammaproteobacteria bacterium]|nr:MAG: glutathione peroxidase [Gammaproteobacteria bacterium]
MTPPLYNLSINSLQGKLIDLADYKGKVILIVNTASECGLTSQYEGLQTLHEQYKEQGLVIIGIPCNQFGKQEPGDAETISQGCLINYGVDFLMAEKVDVNGPESHAIFTYLRDALPGLLSNNIKWNFTKFLIDRDGKPLARFAPITKPKKLEKAIKLALEK